MQLNGTTWAPLGAGPDTSVNALAVIGGTLYAGGDFTSRASGTIALAHIGQWNGTTWSAVGTGVGGLGNTVKALAVIGGTLYAGGSFTTAGGVAANNIARWDGSAWSALGVGLGGGAANALAASGSALWVGGAFLTAGGPSATGLARWDGTNWSGFTAPTLAWSLPSQSADALRRR